jgi:hypothetical protein
MNKISDKVFGGERPLFAISDTELDHVRITAGESAIKECSGIVCRDCQFEGKYPLWHVAGSDIRNCHFAPGSRSAIWYSDNMHMEDCVIDAPKFFREMKGLSLKNVVINDADETFWDVSELTVDNVVLHGGTYPFMHCNGVRVNGLEADSLYLFQYCKDVVIRNARIDTKDAFWEVDNISIYDSELKGEYLGWHSRGLRLVNCHIAGEQPLCYATDLTLENCTFDPECDRAFEYSTLHADIRGHIKSVKNPASGIIVTDSYGDIIIDDNIKGPADCRITTRKP